MKHGPYRLRYSNRSMQRTYEEMMRAARDPSSELYLKDGRRHTGALHRCAFWDGYDGLTRTPHASPGTLAWACFMAGRDHRAAEKRRKA
jgi:hypothetical protein